jgi:hypothetical protein
MNDAEVALTLALKKAKEEEKVRARKFLHCNNDDCPFNRQSLDTLTDFGVAEAWCTQSTEFWCHCLRWL